MSEAVITVRAAVTRVDVDVIAGDPLDLTVPLLDDATEQPVPITSAAGWSGRAQIRRNIHSTVVLHEFTTTGPNPTSYVVTGTAGAIRLTATAAQTGAWQQVWPSWVTGWDLDVTDPTGAVHQVATGLIRLRPQYTR